MITTIFLGLQKDRNGSDIEPLAANDTLTCIKRNAARRFGGYSVAIVFGGWISPEGELVEEMAARLEIVSDVSVREFAVWAGRMLNQSSVLCVENGAHEFLEVDYAVELLDARNRNTELANAA